MAINDLFGSVKRKVGAGVLGLGLVMGGYGGIGCGEDEGKKGKYLCQFPAAHGNECSCTLRTEATISPDEERRSFAYNEISPECVSSCSEEEIQAIYNAYKCALAKEQNLIVVNRGGVCVSPYGAGQLYSDEILGPNDKAICDHITSMPWYQKCFVDTGVEDLCDY